VLKRLSTPIGLCIRAVRARSQHTSAYVSIRQHTSVHFSIQKVEHYYRALHKSCSSSQSAYVSSIRQHTSVHFSIRQYTSAYVSIRQHTSAYVLVFNRKPRHRALHTQRCLRPPLLRQHWYFCTSKASKLNTRDVQQAAAAPAKF
jgi:hypothetical protein